MKRLVCVVEGYGDVLALPNLCSRIRDYLGVTDWIVDPNPVRQPRSSLVDESKRSPRRPVRVEGIQKAIALAVQRPAHGILITCDADDDCPAAWGPSARAELNARCPGDCVMISREYEAWLLYAFGSAERLANRIGEPETIRDAKGKLRKLIPGYKPTTHQLQVTRKVDIGELWKASNSFDKLMRSLIQLFAVSPPQRP